MLAKENIAEIQIPSHSSFFTNTHLRSFIEMYVFSGMLTNHLINRPIDVLRMVNYCTVSTGDLGFPTRCKRLRRGQQPIIFSKTA